MVYPGLLKSGKVEIENAIDRGNLRKILGIHCKKLTLIVKNIFSAGLRLLQGTKRLFTIERGQPASEDLQGKADFEKFIMGREITEFVNKVRDQVRIRQKRMSSIAEKLYRTFDSMGNVYGYNIECSHIHGKELFNDAECCAE